MKKQFNVYLHPKEIVVESTKTINEYVFRFVSDDPLPLEVTEGVLTVEIPEKKIEITESEFDDAWVKYLNTSNILNEHDFTRLKKELGF